MFDDTLLHSGDICDQLAKSQKLCFWPTFFLGGQGPSLTEFYKSWSPLNVEQNLVMIDEATSETG